MKFGDIQIIILLYYIFRLQRGVNSEQMADNAEHGLAFVLSRSWCLADVTALGSIN